MRLIILNVAAVMAVGLAAAACAGASISSPAVSGSNPAVSVSTPAPSFYGQEWLDDPRVRLCAPGMQLPDAIAITELKNGEEFWEIFPAERRDGGARKFILQAEDPLLVVVYRGRYPGSLEEQPNRPGKVDVCVVYGLYGFSILEDVDGSGSPIL